MTSTPTPVQNDWVRGRNRLSVYQLLLSRGELTRAEVARATGLSVPTVSTILAEFSKVGLLRAAGEAQPRGGRPAQVLALDAASRHVLALDLSTKRPQAALLDLRENLRTLEEGPELGPGREAALTAWLGKLIPSLGNKERVARLAVAVPGVVDSASGHVRLAPALGWTDYPLRQVFSQVIDAPIVLENDVNALAVADKANLGSAGFSHALFLRIDGGIGASLLIGGDLYRGATSAAGEIGYSLLPDLSGDLTLGAPGPLETYLLKLEAAFLDDRGQVSLTTQAAREAFCTFAATLGMVVHNLVCLLNPQCVVLSWPADLEGRLAAHLSATWRGPFAVRFNTSTQDPAAALRGVAHLALAELAKDLCLTPDQERGGP